MDAVMEKRILNEEQITFYKKEGYLLLEQLVSHKAIDRALEGAPKYTSMDGDVKGLWKSEPWDFYDHLKNAEIHQLLLEKSVANVAETLLEEKIVIHYGMMAVVPAGGGKGLPWHQDNMYTRITGKALNIFIALCDISPEKANLWIAPKSHLNGTLPSRDAKEFGEHKQLLGDIGEHFCLPALKKGDACVFNRNTLHRSLKNETDEDRYAYAAQYSAVSATYPENVHGRLKFEALENEYKDAGLIE